MGLDYGCEPLRLALMDKKAPQIPAQLFQPAQWVITWEITQIPAPFQQVTGTPGRESPIELTKNKGGGLRQGAR